jgi:hypothetical protein
VSKQDVVVELYYGGAWHAVPVYERDPITVERSTGAGKTDPSPCTLKLTIDDRAGIYNPEDAMSPLFGLAGRNTPIRVRYPAGVSGVGDRFAGEVSSYAPDQTEEFAVGAGRGDAWVGIEAAGVLRRLDQGADALPSALRTFMAAQAGVLANFPCEDGAGSTAPSNAAANGATATANDVSFGSDDTLPASAGVMTFNSAASSFSARVPDVAASGFVTGVLLFRLDAVPVSAFELFRIEQTGGSVGKMTVTMDAVAFGTNAYAPNGATLLEDGIAQGVDETEWVALHYGLFQSSPGTIGYAMYVHQASGDTISPNTGTFAGTLGRATRIVIDPNAALANAKFAHIVVTNAAFPFVTSGLRKAVDAWAGWENALERLQRLCDGASVTFIPSGAIPTDAQGGRETLGAQLSDTRISLMAECERRNDGLLFEPRDALGIRYRTRENLYNQAAMLTLDWDADEVTPPLRPILDDLGSRNDVTVSRVGGGSARAVLEDGPMSVLAPAAGGIGRYPTTVNMSSFNDSVLPGLASWYMRKYTVGGVRFSAVTVDVDIVPGAALVDIGDRIDLTNLPTRISRDDASLMVLGYTEVIETHRRKITFVCTPYEPYRVATWTPGTLRYNFDSTSQGWAGEAGVVVARVTSPVHDGAGALRATKTMSAGTDSIRFNDSVNVTSDESSDGPVLTVWAQVPAGAAGSAWAAHIELQDAGFTWHAGANTTLVKGTWALLTYTPPPELLRACKALGVQFEATGVGGSQAVYIDSPRQTGETPSRWTSTHTTLAADFHAGTDATMSIAVPAGFKLWTTTAAHFSQDLAVDGARVHATGISGTSSPQTVAVSTTIVNGVTKIIPAGTPVTPWKPARYAL